MHFNRLVSIFCVEGGHAKDAVTDYKSWLVAIQKGDLLNKAMEELDVLDTRRGWTRSMLMVLSHLCELGIAECDRTLELPRTRTFLTGLLNDAVRPWINATYDAKATSFYEKMLHLKICPNLPTAFSLAPKPHHSHDQVRAKFLDGRTNLPPHRLSQVCCLIARGMYRFSKAEWRSSALWSSFPNEV